jgi:hypothetical protein
MMSGGNQKNAGCEKAQQQQREENHAGENAMPGHAASTSPLDVGLAQAAEAPLAVTVFQERLEQVNPPEIGPERRRHVEFGVGELPEEEIADAVFAAGADHEIGIGQAGGIERRGNRGLIDGVSGGSSPAAARAARPHARTISSRPP